MKHLSEQEYEALIEGGTILEQDGNGPKVIALDNNRYFKAFYHKSWFSGSRVFSRAQKFADNARKLCRADIKSVNIEQVFTLRSPTRHCVVYQGVDGITLRDALKQSPKDVELCEKVGEFIAELHNKGIIFRSLHLGNVIVMPDKTLALIDISDMIVRSFPLIRWQRTRNFLHVLRYREDKDLLDLSALSQGYIQADRYRKFELVELQQLLEQTLPKAER